METTLQPTMKPVLVTQVSDDIRVLNQGTDVKQQQTVLTARAMRDMFAGTEVSTENANDTKYFSTVAATFGKIDLNLIVDPSCRYIPDSTCVNGPQQALHTGSTTDFFGGFLYTLAVLPSGELVWGGDPRTSSPATCVNGGVAFTEDEALDAERSAAIAEGSILRQVYWTHNTATVDGETIGSINDSEGYTRIGYCHYVSGVLTYVWGDWSPLSGERLYIVVTDPMQTEVLNPIVNAVYSVHCTISNFELPQANNYKYGTTLTVIQYPDPNENDRAAWNTLVTYVYEDEDLDIDEDMKQLCTPSPNRNTARKDRAYLEALSPSEYEFVVVPIVQDGTAIGKTWELVVAAEETEFTSGIAEMLSAHTDPGVNDMVDYLNIHYREESVIYTPSRQSTLVFNRGMPCSGYVNINVRKISNLLATDWKFTAMYVATDSDANFAQVNTTDSSKSGYQTYPTAGVLYFFKKPITESGVMRYVYELCIDSSGDYEPGYLNPGVPFTAGKVYYTLSSAALQVPICTYTGEQLVAGETRQIHKYLGRHNILYLSIKPGTGQNHQDVRTGQYANVWVGVSPDPHRGAYVSKNMINPYAYTEFQFARMKERGEICTDIVSEDGHAAAAAELPVSSEALFNAYKYLSSKLQSRGILNGVIDLGEGYSGSILDNLTAFGFYRATPLNEVPSVSGLGWPRGIVSTCPADIFVIGDTVAAINSLHEESQYTVTSDASPITKKLTPDTRVDASKTYYTYNAGTSTYTPVAYPTGNPHANGYYEDATYYYWDRSDHVFKLADGTGHPTSFDSKYAPYYEKTSMAVRSSGHVAQVVMQTDGATKMWMRQYDRASGTWSGWMGNVLPEVVSDFRGQSSILQATITNLLRYGNPVIRVGTSGSTVSVFVQLPALADNSTLKFVIDGGSRSVAFGSGSATVTDPDYVYDASTIPSSKIVFITAKRFGDKWYYKSDVMESEITSV